MKRITEYENITTVAEADVLPIVDVSDTEQASTGSTRKGSVETIADYLKTRTETLTNKTLTSPVLTTADINTPDIDGGTIDGATINSGSIGSDTNVVEVLKKVYPVGCIYISSVNTSPVTLFGFGTWVLVGEGRALFGVNSADSDFDTAEKMGGAKTVTLTAAQSGVPAHKHRVAKIGTRSDASGYGNYVADVGGATNSLYAASMDTNDNIAANASQAHSILNPYYTAYFYKRTA